MSLLELDKAIEKMKQSTIDNIVKMADMSKGNLLVEKNRAEKAIEALKSANSSEYDIRVMTRLWEEIQRRLNIIESVTDDCVELVREGYNVRFKELTSLFLCCNERNGDHFEFDWREQVWLPLWRSTSVWSQLKAMRIAQEIVAQGEK